MEQPGWAPTSLPAAFIRPQHALRSLCHFFLALWVQQGCAELAALTATPHCASFFSVLNIPAPCIGADSNSFVNQSCASEFPSSDLAEYAYTGWWRLHLTPELRSIIIAFPYQSHQLVAPTWMSCFSNNLLSPAVTFFLLLFLTFLNSINS